MVTIPLWTADEIRMSAPAASVVTTGRSPHWFDPAHQAAITAAYESLCTTISAMRVVGARTPVGPTAHRVRELGRLAAASQLPARAALLRWGALPASARQQLLDAWYTPAR